MTLIERIKEKINENKLSVRGLEIKAGLSNGTLKKWEKQKPSYDKVLDVANALNISVEWLITGKAAGEITPEEQKLLDDFRGTNQEGKDKDLDFCRDMRKIYPADPEGVSTSKPGKTGTDN